MVRLNSPDDLEKLRSELIAKTDFIKPAVTLCISTGCEALGAKDVLQAFQDEFKKQGLDGKVDIKQTGCLGFCETGPRVVIYPENIAYFKVQASDVPEIVSRTVIYNVLIGF